MGTLTDVHIQTKKVTLGAKWTQSKNESSNEHREVASRNTSWIVAPHVTN